MVGLRHRCELIRGFAGGGDEPLHHPHPPKNRWIMWDGNSSRVGRRDTGGGLGNERKQEIAGENEDVHKNVTAEGKVVKDADWLKLGDVEPSFGVPTCPFLREIFNSEVNIYRTAINVVYSAEDKY